MRHAVDLCEMKLWARPTPPGGIQRLASSSKNAVERVHEPMCLGPAGFDERVERVPQSLAALSVLNENDAEVRQVPFDNSHDLFHGEFLVLVPAFATRADCLGDQE